MHDRNAKAAKGGGGDTMTAAELLEARFLDIMRKGLVTLPFAVAAQAALEAVTLVRKMDRPDVRATISTASDAQILDMLLARVPPEHGGTKATPPTA